METTVSGIEKLLWFIHRTLFEHIPAILLLVFSVFCLSELKVPLVEKWTNYFSSIDNAGVTAIVLIAVVILLHSFISALSNLLIDWRGDDMLNLDAYPYYKKFQEKIEKDLTLAEIKVLTPTDVYKIIRYEIMQNKKAFDTFLWYDSTKWDMVRNFAVVIFMSNTFFLPFVVSPGSNNSDTLNYLLFCALSSVIYLFLYYAYVSKLRQINKNEERKNENPIDKTKLSIWGTFFLRSNNLFKFKWQEVILILGFVGGGILSWHVHCHQDSNCAVLLDFLSVTLLILPIPYFLLVYEFIESKMFNKVLVDSWISMRYGDELFNKKKSDKNTKCYEVSETLS